MEARFIFAFGHVLLLGALMCGCGDGEAPITGGTRGDGGTPRNDAGGGGPGDGGATDVGVAPDAGDQDGGANDAAADDIGSGDAGGPDTGGIGDGGGDAGADGGGGENPFGLMLGATGLSIDERIAIVVDLGARYFRPNAVIAEGFNGQCGECETATAAGLKLVLTVRANGGGGYQPTSPPSDIAAYKQSIGAILDAFSPHILVVENEENSSLFYTGTPAEYGAELAAACEVARAAGVLCTNGGMVSKLAALLVYHHYKDSGDTAAADSFAKRAFEPAERGKIDGPQAMEQVAVGRDLLVAYGASGADFVNFHWYESDSPALAEAVAFFRAGTGMPVMTNEIGQQNEQTPETVIGHMTKILELGIPYAVWYSVVGSPQAEALINEDGTLRSNGEAFQEFVRTRFP